MEQEPSALDEDSKSCLNITKNSDESESSSIVSEASLDDEVCEFCGIEAKLRCGKCNDVFYCSREHQRQHWADQHWLECKSYKLFNSSEQGRYLVASRDLKVGNLIISEEPVCIAPKLVSTPMCLGCHVPLAPNHTFVCPDCKWPMCSLKCCNGTHDGRECEILARDTKRIGVPEGYDKTPKYDLILILRCLLLRDSNPRAWKRVLAMASHWEARKRDAEPHHVTAVRYLTEVCNVDFDVDIIHHIRGLIITNCFEIRGPKGGRVRGVYPDVALFNHSCNPNVHLASSMDSILETRASVDIKKGDALHISYTSNYGILM